MAIKHEVTLDDELQVMDDILSRGNHSAEKRKGLKLSCCLSAIVGFLIIKII